MAASPAYAHLPFDQQISFILASSTFSDAVADFKRRYLKEALQQERWQIRAAARRVGMHHVQFLRVCRELGVTRKRGAHHARVTSVL